MEPNQKTNNAQKPVGATSVAPSVGAPNVAGMASEPSAPSVSNAPDISGEDVVFRDKPKKNMAVILTIVFLILLAAGGIGFGVWAMMDGNSQVAKKDEQIAALKKQNNELMDKVTDLEEKNSKAQSEAAGPQDQTEKTEDQSTAEKKEDAEASGEGYRVFSIGDCTIDGGTVAGGSTTGGIISLKCEAETSLGKGKFVWNSEENKLHFVTSTEN